MNKDIAICTALEMNNAGIIEYSAWCCFVLQWTVTSYFLMMDLLLLNNPKSDGKRPQITRLPQSSGILLNW